MTNVLLVGSFQFLQLPLAHLGEPAAERAARYSLTTPSDEVEDLMAHDRPPSSVQREIYQALMKHFVA